MRKWLLGPMFLTLAAVLLPALATAQNVTGSAITGVVRDTSGALLPGVTVEASSPALIEKVRIRRDRRPGRLPDIDLRPGVYTVTFTLSGFSTLRREGVGLTAGFTATVNGDMAVGSLEETITVSGAAPLVDTQNVAQQQVYSREVTDDLPLGSNIRNYAALLPGAVLTGGVTQDVGGGKSEFSQAFIIHGGRATDFQQLREGMFFGTLVAAGNVMTSLNPATVDEVLVTTSSATAELASGGVLLNVVPRDGGNSYRATFNATVSDRSLQSDNLDDALRARGVVSSPYLRQRYDVGGGLGGPIQQDKLWFFLSLRSWVTSDYYPGLYFNKTPGTLLYEPDTSRLAYEDNGYKEARIRTTWQMTPKNKLVAMFGRDWVCNCPGFPTGGFLRSPETFVGQDYYPNYQAQLMWTRPATNRLLMEAGAVIVNGKLNLKRFAATPNDRQFVLDSSTNFGYGNASTTIAGMAGSRLPAFRPDEPEVRRVVRYRVPRVQGWDSADAGVAQHAVFDGRGDQRDQLRIQRAGADDRELFASPLGDKGRQLTVGLFVQDQWTIDRLTLNLGHANRLLQRPRSAGVAAGRDMGAGAQLPRSEDVPNWKDWAPRVGAAYDLFGSGRTAVKGFAGRYVIFEPMGGIILQNSPVNSMVTTASRAWTDANGDYVPQDSELGPLSNASFGQVVRRTTFADEVLTGNRPYNWQGSLQLQQQLWHGVAINVGYFRTWYGNFRVTVNEAVTAQDFNPYCVTAPSNQVLPGGGGQRICGLYDVVPAKFGQSNSLITLADKYGKQREVYNGVDVTMTARFGRGGFLQGGVSTGTTATNNCYQNELPNITAQGSLASTPRSPVLRCQHALVRQHPIQSVGGVPDLVGFPGERELPGPAARSHGGGLRGVECRGRDIARAGVSLRAARACRAHLP